MDIALKNIFWKTRGRSWDYKLLCHPSFLSHQHLIDFEKLSDTIFQDVSIAQGSGLLVGSIRFTGMIDTNVVYCASAFVDTDFLDEFDRPVKQRLICFLEARDLLYPQDAEWGVKMVRSLQKIYHAVLVDFDADGVVDEESVDVSFSTLSHNHPHSFEITEMNSFEYEVILPSFPQDFIKDLKDLIFEIVLGLYKHKDINDWCAAFEADCRDSFIKQCSMTNLTWRWDVIKELKKDEPTWQQLIPELLRKYLSVFENIGLLDDRLSDDDLAEIISNAINKAMKLFLKKDIIFSSPKDQMVLFFLEELKKLQ